MQQKYLAVLMLCTLVMPGQAFADNFGDRTVPVEVATAAPQMPCNPRAGSVQGCYQAPIASPAVSAVTPAPIPVQPNTAIPQGYFAKLETNTLNTIERLFSTAINTSITIGVHLYVLFAICSCLAALIGVCFGESFESFVRSIYRRLIEGSLWIAFISWTWVAPWGGPGWFPLFIGGLASIGAQIADMTSGTQLVSFTNHIFEFNILPGSIADLGAALFGAISKLGYTQIVGQPSNLPGVIGAGVDTIQTAVAIIGSALTGTLMFNIVLYVFYIIAGAYVYCACLWLSFTYFERTVKIYAVACLSMIMGFAGSRRLTSYSGRFVSLCLSAGFEFFLTTILVGIFYSVLIGLIQNTNLWPLVQNALSMVPVIGQPIAAVHSIATLDKVQRSG